MNKFKTLIIICICIIMILLSGCGNSLTPISKAQKRAVEIGNQFLDYKITADEAKEQLESIAIPDPQGDGLSLSVDIDFLGYLLVKNTINYDAVKEKVEYIKSRNYVKMIENKKEDVDDSENTKIDTFDANMKSIVSLFEETGKYIETNVYEFDNNEKNTCGTIRLNPEDYENLFADECIYTEVRTFDDKVFDVSLTYDVSGDEIYYEKLPDLSKKVLATLKPTIEETFFGDFDTSSNDYYSKDFENLRCTISYKEWGETETRINIRIVHIWK